MDSLPPRYRLVTTSLLGYGATAECRPMGNATMRQQTEIIDLIPERIGNGRTVKADDSIAPDVLARLVGNR